MTTPAEFDGARAEFDNVLSQQLRDRWVSHGNVLTTPDGMRFDVSGWVAGEWEYSLAFAGRHDSFYFARLDAVALAELPQRVTCELRIVDPDTVWVDREEPVMDAGGTERST
jgi:hypothetical protein